MTDSGDVQDRRPSGRPDVVQSMSQETTFILIPGAGGEAWIWHRLVPELRDRGYDAVAVDLPAGDASAGLDAYVQTVVDVAGGRPDVAVVAQSMGCLTAPLVCARRPVRLLVLLNAMIPAPGETGGQWWTTSGYQAFRASDTSHDGAFDPIATFFHDVPAEVVEAAIARGEPAQADRPFEDPWPLAG